MDFIEIGWRDKVYQTTARLRPGNARHGERVPAKHEFYVSHALLRSAWLPMRFENEHKFSGPRA